MHNAQRLIVGNSIPETEGLHYESEDIVCSNMKVLAGARNRTGLD